MQTNGTRLQFLITLYTILFSYGLLQSTPRYPKHQGHQSSSTLARALPKTSRPPSSLSVFFANENDKKRPPKANNIGQNDIYNGNADLLQTLQLKDEALNQAQKAVSSLENALDSAVSNLENMQQQLQRQVKELEEELKATRRELDVTKVELGEVKVQLVQARSELENANDSTGGLEWALRQSQEEARRAGERVEELEAYLAEMGVDASSVAEKKKSEVCESCLVSMNNFLCL